MTPQSRTPSAAKAEFPGRSFTLTNAVIHPGAETASCADTVVVTDGVISYVGSFAEANIEAATPVFDLNRRSVLPGLIDSHTHPSSVAQSMWHVLLPATDDLDELLTFIRDYAETHPRDTAPYLHFEYYSRAVFDGTLPTKELLDSAVADRPVLCQESSDHEAWINSAMLELLGVTADTPDPLPGLQVFVRNDRGEPTGLVREGAQRPFMADMFDRLGWTPPEDVTPDRLRPVYRFLTEHGVTAVFEAYVDDDAVFEAVAALDRAGELNMFYEGALRFKDSSDLPDVIRRLKRCHEDYGSRRVRINTLKLILDGTNEIGNSAVLSPLCRHSDAGELGSLALNVDELAECLRIANADAVDVHIHLVGDRAFRVACDAVEIVRGQLRDGWRTQVTLAHCELVDPADMGRPAELGVIVNWTPHWSGGYFGEGAREFLGDERWNRMYRFNEIADSGAVLSFSSDVVSGSELHRGNPFFGMQVASTRVDLDDPLDATRFPGSLRPEATARIARDRLLAGYTIAGAIQLRLEETIGSIESGKAANLVILSDSFTETDDLNSLMCDAVIFEGELVAGSLK